MHGQKNIKLFSDLFQKIMPCTRYPNVGKYYTSGQTTNYSVILRMRVACWITMAKDTLKICNSYCFYTTKMVTRTRVKYYVLRTLPLLLQNELVMYCVLA